MNLHTGVVVSHAGTSPGPSSGISYTIGITRNDGSYFEMPGVRPSDGRWEDGWNIDAAPPGTRFLITELEGRFAYLFGNAEKPVAAECDQGGESAGIYGLLTRVQHRLARITRRLNPLIGGLE